MCFSATTTSTTQLTTTTTTSSSATSTPVSITTTTLSQPLLSALSTNTPPESTSTDSTTTEANQCYCMSLCEDGYLELSLEQKIEKLIQDLTLDKDSLSSVRRKKISVDDDRISAKGIGISGCVVLLCIFMIVVVIDFRRLLMSSKYLMDFLNQKSWS